MVCVWVMVGPGAGAGCILPFDTEWPPCLIGVSYTVWVECAGANTRNIYYRRRRFWWGVGWVGTRVGRSSIMRTDMQRYPRVSRALRETPGFWAWHAAACGHATSPLICLGGKVKGHEI